MPNHSDGETPADSEPPPEAVEAAHDAMLKLNANLVPPDAVAEAPPPEQSSEQPSDHGYDQYDS